MASLFKKCVIVESKITRGKFASALRIYSIISSLVLDIGVFQISPKGKNQEKLGLVSVRAMRLDHLDQSVGLDIVQLETPSLLLYNVVVHHPIV